MTQRITPHSADNGFFMRRKFNVIGRPLVWTEHRSKLTSITWQEVPDLKGIYNITIKLDGKFVRIVKKGITIRMISSGGLDFYHDKLAELLIHFPDGQYNMELIHGDGILKSRDGTGYLTTACAGYRNQDPTCGEWPEGNDLRFVVHDYLAPNFEEGGYHLDTEYMVRWSSIIGTFRSHGPINGSLLRLPMSMKYIARVEDEQVMLKLNLGAQLGYNPMIHEGLVFQEIHAPYRLPINPENFKLKNVKEIVGTVVGVEQDKNNGNGTLILEVLDPPRGGRECRVSSGIDDHIRGMKVHDLLGKRVEVEYESLTVAGNYSMPRIKRIDL